MLDKLTIGDFQKRLNQEFKADLGPEGSLALDLIEVRKMTEREFPEGQRIPFSLEFRGPLTPTLPQRIYSLENAEAGHLDLFLVPLGPDSKGMIYEAVFT